MCGRPCAALGACDLRLRRAESLSRRKKGDGENNHPGDDHEGGHGSGDDPGLFLEAGRSIHVGSQRPLPSKRDPIIPASNEERQ